MKLLKYLLVGSVMGSFLACADPEKSPYIAPEPGVAALGSFLKADGKPQLGTFGIGPDYTSVKGTTWSKSAMNAQIHWVSIDQKIKVNKIELLVNFQEPYTDKDGNPATANHGTKTYSTIDVTTKRFEPTKFTLEAAKVYALFKDATFKYDGSKAVKVFDPTLRPTATPFVAGDYITTTWKLYGDNGLIYKSWGPNICIGTVGYNCQIDLEIE